MIDHRSRAGHETSSPLRDDNQQSPSIPKAPQPAMALALVFLACSFSSTVFSAQLPLIPETTGKPSEMLEVGRLPALGCTPPLRIPFPGYRDRLIKDNTWNAYECNINETVVLENAIFLNRSGLLAAGYNYFVLDGTPPFLSLDPCVFSLNLSGLWDLDGYFRRL